MNKGGGSAPPLTPLFGQSTVNGSSFKCPTQQSPCCDGAFTNSICQNCADSDDNCFLWPTFAGFSVTRLDDLPKTYTNAHGSIDLVKTNRMVQPRAQTDHLGKSYEPSKFEFAILTPNGDRKVPSAFPLLDGLGSKFQEIFLRVFC